MLRLATSDDFQEIYDMSMEFASATAYKDFIDPVYVENLVRELLTPDINTKIVLLHEGTGMIIGRVVPFAFGPTKLATEIAWWINPDRRALGAGRELVDAFEYWGGSVGCTKCVLASLDDSVGKYYEKRGYVLSERAYIKDIK